LAILSICGAYGVPRERVAARDTWVPTVNGENFGELRARCAHERSRRAISTLANLHGGGGGGGGGGGRRGDLLKRAANGEERGEFIPRDFSPYELSAVRATSRASGIEKSSIRRNPLGDDANYRASYRALSRSLRIRSESPADKYAPT